MKELLRISVAPAKGWAMAVLMLVVGLFCAFVFWIIWHKATDAPRWVLWVTSAFMLLIGTACIFSGIPYHLKVGRLSRRPEARFLVVDDEGLSLPVQALDMIPSQRLVLQGYCYLRLSWEHVQGVRQLKDSDGPDYYEITTDLPEGNIRVLQSALGDARSDFYKLVSSRAA